MAAGKWLEGVVAATPVPVAARTALAARLDVVARYLPLAAGKASEDAEHVHQLRVATRRAAAAIEIFGEFLPAKPARRARRLLRTLRRAAGGARDWDVFLLALANSRSAHSKTARPAVDFLTGHALSRRLKAQTDLVEAASEESRALERLLESLPRSVREKGNQQSLADLGFAVLPPLAEAFDGAARAGTTSAEALHTTRIVGKRLRYAMEVFAGCYAPPFKEELYPAVERVQSILGSVQDANVAVERIGELAAHLPLLPGKLAERIGPGIDARLKELRAELRDDQKSFQAWVKEWIEERSRRPFTAYLTPAGEPPTAPTPPAGTTRPKVTRSRSAR